MSKKKQTTKKKATPRKKVALKKEPIKSVSRRRIKFQTPKGTFDILPKEQKYWQRIESIISKMVSDYGFQKITTPIIENEELFAKGTGSSTDIVRKEMYTLRTRGGDRLALRPEFTPALVRAYIEHGMRTWTQPVKLYSLGPVFRHEKPQSGRFRQFHQANLEIIGELDAINDAVLIYLTYLILKKVGIKKFNIEINSIGCKSCRGNYRKTLVSYYRRQRQKLCRDCRERLKTNPLRLLDCKVEKCQQLISGAPQVIDHLCLECHNHFKEVLEFLDELNIPYILNPHLVRGLDYYTKTVFEFKLEESGLELAGGGRYDELVRMLGGNSTPAVGVAAGVERLIATLKEQDTEIPDIAPARVFLAHLGDLGRKRSLLLFEELRKKGLKINEALSKGNIKAQLRTANKMGAELVLILGQRESLENNIIIREMKSGTQEIVPISRIVTEVKRRLSKSKK